jgi:hypothetical protein
MNSLIAAALIFAAQPAAQSEDPFCGQVRALDQAAQSGSFQPALDRGLRLSFLDYCRLHATGGVCNQNLTPAEITPASLARRMSACVPAGRITQRREAYGPIYTVFQRGRLRIEMMDRCTQRCRAGRLMLIYIRNPSS